jgi:ribosomal protein S18 acetylase RimI-like enzyme
LTKTVINGINLKMSLEIPSYNIVPATSLIHLQSIKPVLESAIVDRETKQTIQEDVEYVYDNIVHPGNEAGCGITLIAWSESEAKALGVMSLMKPGLIMTSFAITDKPAELTNAYVLEEVRGANVGKSLVLALENKARMHGAREIVLNSGPRYELSGWPFWRRLYGEQAGVADNYYGDGYHASVWRKTL